ncbi:MAG: hypothetical protein IJG55_05465, partial [Synergistaceae bacterium]|nr:hypothetical protein [Synergistaceae bacterium]
MTRNLIFALMIMMMIAGSGCSSGGSSVRSDSDMHIEVPYVMLNSGYKMPVLGLGTWTQNDSTAEESVYEAIKCGYRLIDTAQYY